MRVFDMLTTVEIDGARYHAQPILTEDGDATGEYELILDESGDPISAKTCICHAYEPNECICGAWDDVSPSDWYDE